MWSVCDFTDNMSNGLGTVVYTHLCTQEGLNLSALGNWTTTLDFSMGSDLSKQKKAMVAIFEVKISIFLTKEEVTVINLDSD